MNTSVWHGTWISDIYNEAYGTVSIGNNTDNTEITILFDGELHKEKTIQGYSETKVPKINFTEQIKLDNIISLIDYTIIKMSDNRIDGTYYCYYPVDNGHFVLSKL